MPKKSEKRRKPSPLNCTVSKKVLLRDQISEVLSGQLDRSKESFDNPSVSLSGDSSSTLHETIRGEEFTPHVKRAELVPQRLSTSFCSEQCTPKPPLQSRCEFHATVCTLDDVATVEAIERLATRYGRVLHMGVLDPTYKIFMNKARTAALSFKVHSKVALIMGDPLCEPCLFTNVLQEFKECRRRYGWGVAFIGASEVFAQYAKEQKWTTVQFGVERVLNPLTNDILNERGGKRIIVQSKQLLNSSKGNISLGLYIPAHGEDLNLQTEFARVYDLWREGRNHPVGQKAFISVYYPFSMPGMRVYIYTRGPDGLVNGFAALRHLGANQGYHIDPCISAPGAPRGIADLLVFAAMTF
ncbi:hypothetical protein IFM53868_09337 [Aspergillus udagawae]|uniref:Phosphatidylglycerol lysyltransferase C-terminal domain-containing protein n=1 Tax=Aspergillus udagawae TaxID=91492 RepID=A0ABQ1BB78_9EURO|nr:hypothetical protein IFM53868_09337 [Aspergillus udagawae]